MEANNEKTQTSEIANDIASLLDVALFRVNDEHTRRIVVGTINGYLNALVMDHDIHDYVIVCDESNNFDPKTLHVDVAIKFSQSTEFVYIPFVVGEAA